MEGVSSGGSPPRDGKNVELSGWRVGGAERGVAEVHRGPVVLPLTAGRPGVGARREGCGVARLGAWRAHGSTGQSQNTKIAPLRQHRRTAGAPSLPSRTNRPQSSSCVCFAGSVAQKKLKQQPVLNGRFCDVLRDEQHRCSRYCCARRLHTHLARCVGLLLLSRALLALTHAGNAERGGPPDIRHRPRHPHEGAHGGEADAPRGSRHRRHLRHRRGDAPAARGRGCRPG